MRPANATPVERHVALEGRLLFAVMGSVRKTLFTDPFGNEAVDVQRTDEPLLFR
jgi:hypothetical protein